MPFFSKKFVMAEASALASCFIDTSINPKNRSTTFNPLVYLTQSESCSCLKHLKRNRIHGNFKFLTTEQNKTITLIILTLLHHTLH